MGKVRRWHYPFLTFPIRFSIRQSRRMGKVRRWHYPFLTFPIRFNIRQSRRMGKVRRWHHPFLTFPIRFNIRQSRRIRKVCAATLPLPATGQDAGGGKHADGTESCCFPPPTSRPSLSVVPLDRPSRPAYPLLFTHALPDKAHNKILSA